MDNISGIFWVGWVRVLLDQQRKEGVGFFGKQKIN